LISWSLLALFSLVLELFRRRVGAWVKAPGVDFPLFNPGHQPHRLNRQFGDPVQAADSVTCHRLGSKSRSPGLHQQKEKHPMHPAVVSRYAPDKSHCQNASKSDVVIELLSTPTCPAQQSDALAELRRKPAGAD
jgi:hypothetical protein